jgi:N-sulfoglucosamine sulfohydrolase
LLDNTIVIVTSDHGMPFPRAKGQAYDVSNHVPLAVMWKGGIKTVGRTVSDYVSFADIAPTILELAGLKANQTGMQPMVGGSFTDLLYSSKPGKINSVRDHVLVGKERHDIGRPNDVGYPIRGIHKNDWLYVRNYETERWPAGNPETGYLNCDGGATKTVILQARRDGTEKRHWQWAFGKRPAEELYDVKRDPDCLDNLANDPKYKARKAQLRAQMERELKAQGDPRMFGKGAIFDQYEYANREQVHFYERFLRGEKLKAGWVNETDFEKEPIKQ